MLPALRLPLLGNFLKKEALEFRKWILMLGYENDSLHIVPINFVSHNDFNSDYLESSFKHDNDVL